MKRLYFLLLAGAFACGDTSYAPSREDVSGTYTLTRLEFGPNRYGYGYGDSRFGPPDWYFRALTAVPMSSISGTLDLGMDGHYRVMFKATGGEIDDSLVNGLEEDELIEKAETFLRTVSTGTYQLQSQKRRSEVIIGVTSHTESTSHYIVFEPGTRSLIAKQTETGGSLFEGTIQMVHNLSDSANAYDLAPLAAAMTFRKEP